MDNGRINIRLDEWRITNKQSATLQPRLRPTPKRVRVFSLGFKRICFLMFTDISFFFLSLFVCLLASVFILRICVMVILSFELRIVFRLGSGAGPIFELDNPFVSYHIHSNRIGIPLIQPPALAVSTCAPTSRTCAKLLLPLVA